MLVLSRRVGEKIVIGNNIVVTVVDTARGKVKIGVDAPREITVYRQEIQDIINKKNDPEAV
jgi:carbon storage regulator